MDECQPGDIDCSTDAPSDGKADAWDYTNDPARLANNLKYKLADLPRTGKLDKPVEMPVAVPLDPKPSPKWLDTWWPWLNGAIALVILSYGPMLFQMISNMTLWARGMRVW